MEQTLELQKEFESLVKNLERLKRISDITETNADSTNMIISEIEEFVNFNKDYNTKLKKNLDQTAEKLESTGKNIGVFMDLLHSSHQERAAEYGVIIDNSTHDFRKHLDKAAAGFKTEIHNFTDEVKLINEKIDNLYSSINNKQIDLGKKLVELRAAAENDQKALLEKNEELQEELEDQGLKSTVILYAVVLVIILQIVHFFI